MVQAFPAVHVMAMQTMILNHRPQRNLEVKRTGQRLLLIFLLSSIIGCSAKAATQTAKVYKEEAGWVKPGVYHLQFLLDGRDALSQYLLREKERNPDLHDFEISGLMKLFRNAYPQLYLPVQPGVPLCNLETNFKHCRGIELLADLETYDDDTVVLHSHVFYHIQLRLEGDQPNFFRAAKAQRDRGEFALPRHYYVGSLVEAIQKSVPILQEIATDYRKYIKNDNQEIEIDLTLEESRRSTSAKQSDTNIKDTAEAGSSVILSVLPNLSFIAGLTISALRSGGRTFWEVLEEKKEFDLCKRDLDIDQVEFSYTESIANHLPYLFRKSTESPSNIIIREIKVRLHQKEQNILSSQSGSEQSGSDLPSISADFSSPGEGETRPIRSIPE
jgi:hypothetical protein